MANSMILFVAACVAWFTVAMSQPDEGINAVTYWRGSGRIPDKKPCPQGLRDDGTSCWRDAHIYGKGCCCVIWNRCCNNCRPGYHDDGCTCRRTDVGIVLNLFQRHHCRDDEDLYGTLCYPKCKPGFHSVGCCVCKK